MSIQFSYENQNQSSYLRISFPPTEEVIHYQLQMMTSNNIAGLLPSMKRQRNDDILIYYNITSKISLSQILGRRKLSRQEFLNLLEGAATTWKEIQDYQLECDGICLQEDYIYVKSDTCEPSFVYLPTCTSSRGLMNLKEFIQGLIIKGVVETSSDNFIQILLNVLNDTEFHIEKLEECIQQFRGNKKSPTNVKPVEPIVTPSKVVTPPMPTPDVPIHPPKEAPKQQENVKEPDKEKNKKKFLLFQAPLIVGIAALVSFEVFIDAETGQLLVTNIIAAILIVAALEFVIYREIFVNSKKDEKVPQDKKKNKKKEKKKGKKEDIEIPKRNSYEIPSGNPEKNNSEPASQTPIQGNQNRYIQPEIMPREKIKIPDTEYQETPSEDEDQTDFWDPNQVSEAYLEYFENGTSVQIPFSKDRLLIGRLQEQVDFYVNNTRVGKMHAEFICKNGSYYVQDLNSKNGTYINNDKNRINSNVPYLLANQDQINLADSKFVIHC